MRYLLSFQAAIGFFCWWGLTYNDLWGDVGYALAHPHQTGDFTIALTLLVGPVLFAMGAVAAFMQARKV